jgi:Ser/Thr protein kinase RdoA (MazF antagonist)
MPGHVAELLRHREELAAGLPADRHELITALQPEFARWCGELDAFAIPASIQHDDLHDANILVDGPAYRFFDWGDACVGHPFGVLLIALRVARHQGLEKPVLATIRDAYLEPWTAEYAVADLRRAAALAIRIAIPGRSLSYQRALCTVPFGDRGEDSDAVGGWLNELLAPDLL